MQRKRRGKDFAQNELRKKKKEIEASTSNGEGRADMLVHEESDAFGKGELTACGHVWAAVQGRARDTGMQGRRWPGAERAFLIGSVCVAGAGGSLRLQPTV